MIVRDVSGLEDRVYRECGYTVYTAVDGCHAADLTAIVQNAFDSPVQCGSGGDGTI